jgi:hypothetical protein
LHRIGMEHRKPKAISRKLDPAKQAAFIKGYECNPVRFCGTISKRYLNAI